MWISDHRNYSIRSRSITSVTPLLFKSPNMTWNYTVLASASSISDCRKNRGKCSLQSAWSSCFNSISEFYAFKKRHFSCVINIEPDKNKQIISLNEELNNDVLSRLQVINSTIISIYINGHDNIVAGKSAGQFLNLGINNTNIELSVFVNNVTITSFSSISNSGGAISMTGGSGIVNLDLANININNCFSSNHGGGLYISNLNNVHIHNSSFTNNRAFNGVLDSNGGAIFISTTQKVFLTQSHISGNTASVKGGGLYILSSQLYIVGTTVDHNSATDGGGAHIVNCDNAQLVGLNISYNKCTGDGGGIYFQGSNGFLFSKSTVLGNMGSSYGGGIFIVVNMNSVIRDLLITGNKVNYQGGGIFTRFVQGLLVADSTISKNRVSGKKVVLQ